MFISNAYAAAAARNLGIMDYLSLIAVIAVLVFIAKPRIEKFKMKNYEWYKAAYPNNVQGNQVSCFVCGNKRIQVRALMNRTFFREHFCTQCGKTLYYSPEQN